MLRSRFASLVVGIVVLAVGCTNGGDGDAGDQEGPIILGAAIAQSGFMEPYDTSPFQALELAVSEINAAGGVDGRKIEVIVGNTKTDVTEAKRVADDLISRGAEILVVSCDFDMGSPAAQVAQQQGLVSFSLCAMSSKFGVQGIGPLAYTMGAAAHYEGAGLAEFAYEERGWRQAFVSLDDTQNYDIDQCDGFEQRFTDLAGEDGIVGKETFKNTDTNFAAQISRIKASEAEFVIACTYPPGGASLLRQLRAAGVDLPVVSGLGMDGTYWVEAVPDISDLYVSTPISVFGDDPNSDVNAFTRKFEREYGHLPATGLVVAGYSVAEAIAKAVERADSTEGEKVAEEFNNFDEEDLLVGPTTWTEELHIATTRSMAILEYRNGKPEYLTTVQPAPGIDLRIGLGGT